MKVTAIEPSGNLYGSEQCLLDVIRGTSERGVDWDVVLPAGEFMRLLGAGGIPAKPLLVRDSHTVPRHRKLLSYWRARRHLARRRPQVVYLNQAGMLRATAAITRGLGVPIVCQVQTLEDARFVAAHPEAHGAVTSFICNSRYTASLSAIESRKLSVFYQPVVGSTAESAPPDPGPPWRVGILGRIAESKGHHVFLEAARHLIADGATDIEFVVVGEGLTQDATRGFNDSVTGAGMAKWFDLRGFRADVGSELERMHVVVIPSIAEPLGRVLLDACVARRPAIVSDSGGLGEFSRHLDIGRRVSPEDPRALAAAIRETISKYTGEHERFCASAERALARLTPPSYMEVMTTVIANAAAGRPTASEWLGDPA